MRKILFTLLCAFSALFFLPNAVTANTVTVDGPTGTNSTYLPVALHTNTSNANYAFHSVSQQLYYASELAGASSNTITAITFDYVGTTMAGRKIAVLINSTSLNSFPLPNEENPADEANKTPNMVDPGQRVFSGDVNMVDHESYTITFDTPYEWDGTSNIIVTVLDSTAKKNSKTYYPDATIYTVQVKIFETSGKVRFLHKTSKDNSDYASKGWDMNNLTAAKANSSSVDNRKYANRITFTFAAAPEPPATPTDLSVSAAITSATLSWSGVLGATSYDLQQSADGESWSTLSSGETGTSYNWTGLSAASTHYARIRANNANGSSDWSSPVTVTTDAVHEHNGITFDKWSSTNSLPSEAGNYYLNADVTLPNHYTLPGNINLCLNGHNLYTYAYRIVVPDQKTFAVYNTSDEGMISGAYEAYLTGGQITVDAGGTLILGDKCKVQNIAEPEESGYVSYAIANAGTLRLSGAPVISGTTADIYLSSSNITLVGALTNSSSNKYSVNKLASDFTSGWSTYMEGENPSDHFTSANNSYGGICYNPSTGEARIVKALNFADNADNTSTMSTYTGQLTNVTIGRSFTSASFNTISLPFPLTDAQLEGIFGADYDLREFESSSLDGDVLSLTFSDPLDALAAGKPYLLQPSVEVTNPSFEGVTITATAPADQTSDANISFHGTFAPTELQGGNKNLLFLGAENELFWPASTGDIKGFRAYFEVKGAAQKAKAARIVKKEDQAQALDNIENTRPAQKRILNGQLVIEKNGTFYNAQGQIVK